MMRPLIGSLILLTAVLTGCSTPQAALNQANNGTALMSNLESELQEFRRVQSLVASHRVENIREQYKLLAKIESNTAFNDRVRDLSGKGDYSRVFSSLRTLADSRGKDEEALQAKFNEIDASLGKLLSPLPETSGKLKDAQSKLSAMGEELSMEDRLKTLSSFSKSVYQTVKDNKEKIKEATNSVPAKAPVQAAATPDKKTTSSK